MPPPPPCDDFCENHRDNGDTKSCPAYFSAYGVKPGDNPHRAKPEGMLVGGHVGEDPHQLLAAERLLQDRDLIVIVESGEALGQAKI